MLSKVPGLYMNSDLDSQEFRIWKRIQMCKCGRVHPFSLQIYSLP